MIEKGTMRLNPASFYKDYPNSAICDQELIQRFILPSGTKLYKDDAGNYEEISGIKNITLEKTSAYNFYIYSMARLYQHRLLMILKQTLA